MFDHSNKSYFEGLSNFYVIVLTFESVDEILMSDNLVFNGNIIYLLPLVFYNMKFVIPLEF